ncbi:MAG: hypothetical protein Q9181_008328 [Wetmoreana brouardii]
MQNASMCAQYGVAYQTSSGIIQMNNLTSSQDPGQLRWDETTDISDHTAINGTAVSCWFYISREDADRDIEFQIIYQTTESKIEEAYRLWGPDGRVISYLKCATTSSARYARNTKRQAIAAHYVVSIQYTPKTEKPKLEPSVPPKDLGTIIKPLRALPANLRRQNISKFQDENGAKNQSKEFM